MGHLSLERLSSSRRFYFKPITKDKMTLKHFEMYYYDIFCFIFCFNLMVSSIHGEGSGPAATIKLSPQQNVAVIDKMHAFHR